MRERSLALAFAFAAILTASSLHGDHRRSDHIKYACPPFEEDASPEYPSDCGASGLEVAFIALGVGLLGYLAGRFSAPVPASPDPVKVESAVKGVFTDRIGEAGKHGMAGAIPLLDQARDDVLAALKKEGVLK